MRDCIIKFSALAFILFLIACKTEKSNTKEKDSSTEERLYLGQEPPGLTPEPFALGLVTTGGWEYSGVFSLEMKEFYFLRKIEGVKKQEFVVYINEGNKWTQTVISSRQGQPFISPDGKTMHLGRRYKERKKNGNWSETKKLGTPFDSLPIMRLTASSKETYFFDEFKEDFTGDIRYSRLINENMRSPNYLIKILILGEAFILI